MRCNRSELRAHPRAVFRQPVCYYKWADKRAGLGAEISAGGMFLQTGAPLDVGTLITLRVQVPGDRAHTILGRVVRSQRAAQGSLAVSGMGIRFVDISAEARQAIVDYVERRFVPLQVLPLAS